MDRLICAPCLVALWSAATMVEVQGEGRISALPGLSLLRAVQEAADERLPLVINNNTAARFYADTTLRGTSVCAGHMHEVMYSSTRGEPW